MSSCDFSKENHSLETQKHENIIGKWQVIDSNFLPFDYISICPASDLESIFDFGQSGIFKIYNTIDSADYCNSGQSYRIENNHLIIFDLEETWNYEILKLTSDSLKIKHNKIPFYLIQELFVGTGNDYNDDPKVKFIREVGIIVTMAKLKNGG